jgi:hypothetical protein
MNEPPVPNYPAGPAPVQPPGTASPIIPLSRRPRWRLLALVPLLGVLLPASVLRIIQSHKAFPSVEWLVTLYATVFVGFFCRSVALLAITDYDADYLYLFQKAGPLPIPLGSFYKLVAVRGGWKLYYLDAQHQKQHLEIVPLRSGWGWRSDDTSIQTFSEAVRHHNPSLDVQAGWFR